MKGGPSGGPDVYGHAHGGDLATPQIVTVTGVDEPVVDGHDHLHDRHGPGDGTDPTYNTRDAADVAATNTDNDTAGITSWRPPGTLTTTEAGGTTTFAVVLNTHPTADVTIGVSSSNLAEGTVAPTSLLFTPVNWQTPQTVTVTGVDDAVCRRARSPTRL